MLTLQDANPESAATAGETGMDFGSCNGLACPFIAVDGSETNDSRADFWEVAVRPLLSDTFDGGTF